MSTRKAKLTKRLVESLKPAVKPYIVTDTVTPGFMVRVSTSGERTFYVYYRAGGVQRRPALGAYHERAFSVERARAKAEQYLALVRQGRDPSAERQDASRAETLAEFADAYLKDAEPRLKNHTLEDYRRRLRLHILPAWGKKKLTVIRPADVANLHRKLAKRRILTITPHNSEKSYTREQGGPVGANRYLALIKSLFATAERWGLIPPSTNPARHVRKFKEKSRERYLSPDELARLADALTWAEREKMAAPWAIEAIRLLMFTGARRNEILTLQWAFVDVEGRCLRLPESKTGPKVIHLNAPALQCLERLARIRELDNPYVIVGHKRGAHLVNLTKPWDRIRVHAALPDLRIHDLRHVYAGMGAALGLGLPIIGKLLGHSQPSTTNRYANLAPDPVAAANERIGEALLEAMEKGKACVVEIGKADKSADPLPHLR